MFVGMALANTLHLLGADVPGWLPSVTPNNQMGPGMVIGLWAFLLPFIAIGMVFVLASAFALWGRFEACVRGGEGSVFTGFGTLGWTRRFNATGVSQVQVGQSRWQANNPAASAILLTSEEKTFEFGTLLPRDRQVFIAQALSVILKRP